MSETTARFVYVGKRQHSRGLAHAWLREDDLDGDEMLYTKLKASVVGGVYEVEIVEQDDDHTTVRAGTLGWQGEKVDDGDLVANWELRSRAAQQAHDVEKAEKRAASDSELARAMDPLRRIIWRDGNPSRRWALAHAITQELMRPPTKAEREDW